MIVALEEDVETLLADHPGSKLLITVTATDAQSGTTVILRQAYTKDEIKAGDWKRNLDFDYLPTSPTPRKPPTAAAATGG